MVRKEGRRASAIAAAAFALVASLATSAPAEAYVRTRSPDGKFELLWPDARITMTLRTSGPQIVAAADLRTAATRAGAAWSAPALGSSVAFTIDASTDAPPGTRFDHVNTISFRTDGWSAPIYPKEALALTTVWSQDERIVDADTELNAADPSVKWGVLPDDPMLAAAASEVDLQNALTHELGHVLGLAHPCFLGAPPRAPAADVDDRGRPILSCSDPTLPASVAAATMFPSSTAGSISERDLSADEEQALHDLYPAHQDPPPEGPGLADRSGGCAVPGSGPRGALAALAFAALVLAARRRASLTRR
jgi:hypothetical protein